MATRKKKTEVIESAEIAESMEMPGTIGSAKIVFSEPKVVKGSHLTVTTYPDGKTTLEWDDAALAKEVREATEAYELDNLKPAVKAKVASRKKKNSVK
jgi:hypothetical protein